MFGTPVHRRRGTTVVGTDRYGNDILEPEVVLLDQRAAFSPGGSSEPVEADRASVVTEPTLYFTEAPDITERDDVMVRGEWFHVDGVPAVYVSPFDGVTGGVVVRLKRVSG